jgi:hypothetical protein
LLVISVAIMDFFNTSSFRGDDPSTYARALVSNQTASSVSPAAEDRIHPRSKFPNDANTNSASDLLGKQFQATFKKSFPLENMHVVGKDEVKVSACGSLSLTSLAPSLQLPPSPFTFSTCPKRRLDDAPEAARADKRIRRAEVAAILAQAANVAFTMGTTSLGQIQPESSGVGRRRYQRRNSVVIRRIMPLGMLHGVEPPTDNDEELGQTASHRITRMAPS